MIVDRAVWDEMFSTLYADEDIPPEQATNKYIDYYNEGTAFLDKGDYPMALASFLKSLGIFDRYFLAPEVQSSPEPIWQQLLETRPQLLIRLGFASLGMGRQDMTKAFWCRVIKEGAPADIQANIRRWSHQFKLDRDS